MRMLLPSVLVSIIFSYTSHSQITYFLPGQGDTVQHLNFENPNIVNQNFQYHVGWAGTGLGFTGSQRGAPEVIQGIANPFPTSSSGDYVFSFYSKSRDSAWYADNPGAVGTNVYGDPDSEPQDDLFSIYSQAWNVADTPSATMHVYLPSSAAYTSIRMPSMYGTTNTFPGIWLYGDYFALRGPGRPDIWLPTNASNEGTDTWWTLGITITPSGDLQYYATPEYVQNLTKEHCIGINSQLCEEHSESYNALTACLGQSIIMTSNNNFGSSSPTLFDDLGHGLGGPIQQEEKLFFVSDTMYVNEGDGSVSIPIHASGIVSDTAWVKVTRLEGNGVDIDGFDTDTLYFLPGSTSQSLEIDITDDISIENTEHFKFQMEESENAHFENNTFIILAIDDNDFLNTTEKSLAKPRIRPNPTVEDIYIEGLQQDHSYKVVDLFGRTVLQGTTDEKISLKELSHGSYVLHIDGYREVRIRKK